METALTRRRGPVGEGKGAAVVGDERACEAVVRFALVDVDEATA
jgi:hypothetical protein